METAAQVKECEILHSDSTRYLIMEFKGEGCFGQVAKCLDLITTKTVAVKILKKDQEHLIEREVEMLQAIRTLDPDKSNIVRFMESFRFQNHSCMVFEMLDRSLWDLMKEKSWHILDLNEIRSVIYQLLVAFDALKSLGIMHTDLKPDNVMLVNHKAKPLKIKLIDFGLALSESEVEPGMIIQPCSYRAPEVTLGLPLSTAVDMWSVGCIMANMYFGQCLFPNNCNYNWMAVTIQLLGQPDYWHLSAGSETWKYFTRDLTNGEWRFRTPREYEVITGIKPKMSTEFLSEVKDLEDMVDRWRLQPTDDDPVELKDKMAFLSLLKSCLNVNCAERITPREAMKYCFLTMDHLKNDSQVSVYAQTAFALMANLDELHNSPDAENAAHDHGGNEETDVPGLYINDYSNTALMADRSEPFPARPQDEDNECDSDKSHHSDIGSLFGGDLNSASTIDINGDVETSGETEARTHSSLLSFTNEDAVEPEYPHSTHREPSTEVSCHENSTGPSTATDLHDVVRNTTTPSKEESGTAAAIIEDNTDNVCLSVNNDTDGNAPADGTATPICSKDGDAAATRPTDVFNTDPEGANINANPDRTGINTGPTVADITTDPDGADINASPDRTEINTGPYGIDISASLDGPNIKTGPDGATIKTGPDGANINAGPDGANIKTGPDGAPRKTFFRRARKFFGRVRKRVLAILICGKIESDN